MTQAAVIFGFEGTVLSDAEKGFFREADPFGFIIFARNIDSPNQMGRLTDSLRDLTGRDTTPVLVDQEGGRVARFRPPHWRNTVPADVYGQLYAADPELGKEATRLNSRLLADELLNMGVNVDCVPMLDVRAKDANEQVIGDRAFSDRSDVVTTLGRVQMEAVLSAGMIPVIKHMPGHGRARIDSHDALPVVEASLADLEAVDFAPFRALNDAPMGMTGHLEFTQIDAGEVSTFSKKLIDEIIRSDEPGRIGFDGLLLTDDISMGALGIDYESRTKKAYAAGCDIILHCNGEPEEMTAIANEMKGLSGKALDRSERALTFLGSPTDFDPSEAEARLQSLISKVMT